MRCSIPCVFAMKEMISFEVLPRCHVELVGALKITSLSLPLLCFSSMLPRPYQRTAERLSLTSRLKRAIFRIKRFIGTGKRRAKVIGCTTLLVVLFVRIFTSRRVLRNLCYWWDPGSKGAKALTLGFGPPTYEKLKRWEDNLPQHNLDLPYPEGKTGRYVKFSNQIKKLGWNNVFNELCVFIPHPTVSSS